ncbi:MAG: hypothetical protein M3303_11310 [Gemmatimonadota bacterium]|nr:hypothetical protein [Gemmatimonadota bacterium]
MGARAERRHQGDGGLGLVTSPVAGSAAVRIGRASEATIANPSAENGGERRTTITRD